MAISPHRRNISPLLRVAGAVLATAIAVAVAGPVRQSAALTGGPQVGAVADITWGTSRADIDRTVSMMVDSGVRWVRANVAWSGVEPDAKGVLNHGWLADIDYAVTKARTAGMQVLMPFADGVPYWASADPAKYKDATGAHWNKYWRPANPSDYADFVRTMVDRYKSMGVHTYEVWNEPNHLRLWPSGPNAGEYKALLAAAYPVIKAADPQATVLMGGLSKNDYTYLESLYAAGAAPYFDAVAIHPYTGNVDPNWCWNEGSTTRLAKDAFCGIEEVRRTMEANGDSAKRVWVTEFGWSTTTGPYGVSEALQATYLTAALTKLQAYPFVETAFWYNFRNNWFLNNDPADYEANLGLLRTDFSAKPAYDALRTWTATNAPVATTTTTSTTTTSTTTTAPPTTTTTAPPTTTTTTAPAPDTQPPVISNVRVAKTGTNWATITWSTNEPSTSYVDYWTAGKPALTAGNSRLVTSHTVTLQSLTRKTVYSYRVRSTDAAGNTSVSSTGSFAIR